MLDQPTSSPMMTMMFGFGAGFWACVGLVANIVPAARDPAASKPTSLGNDFRDIERAFLVELRGRPLSRRSRLTLPCARYRQAGGRAYTDLAERRKHPGRTVGNGNWRR